jgi:hypothetical protein
LACPPKRDASTGVPWRCTVSSADNDGHRLADDAVEAVLGQAQRRLRACVIVVCAVHGLSFPMTGGQVKPGETKEAAP